MTKNELLLLKGKLSSCKRYKMIDILGTDEECVNIELFGEECVVDSNLDRYYGHDNFKAIEFFSGSLEKLVRSLADYGIDYDSIDICFSTLFFMDSKMIDEKLNENSDVLKELWSNDDLLNDRVAMIIFYRVLKDGVDVSYPRDILKYLDKVIENRFVVNYNSFVRQMNNMEYDMNINDFNSLVAARMHGYDLTLSLDFGRDKEDNKKINL